MTIASIAASESVGGGYTFVVSHQTGSLSSDAETLYDVNLPVESKLSGITFGATAVDQGACVTVNALNAAGDNRLLIHRQMLKKADIYETVTFAQPMSVPALGGYEIIHDSAGATATVVTFDCEFKLKTNTAIIELFQDITAVDDEEGATRAMGSAATCTNSVDTTVVKTMGTSLKMVKTGANQTNDDYNGWYLSRSGQAWDISESTTLHGWFYAAVVANAAEYGVILEDSGGNYSYWTFAMAANTTWYEKPMTLATPTGNSGTACDLTDVTKIIVYFKSEAAAADMTWYCDSLWVE
jgi:hypothetical protein